MAGNFTDSTDRAFLDYITGTSLGTWTPPVTTYIMLLTANPATTAAVPTDPQLSELAELTAIGYSRQIATWSSSTSPSNGVSQIQNNNLLTFGPFTGASGSGSATTYGAMVNVATGTTGLVYATWSWNQSILAPQNQTITIPIASLTFTQQ